MRKEGETARMVNNVQCVDPLPRVVIELDELETSLALSLRGSAGFNQATPITRRA